MSFKGLRITAAAGFAHPHRLLQRAEYAQCMYVYVCVQIWAYSSVTDSRDDESMAGRCLLDAKFTWIDGWCQKKLTTSVL